MTLFHSFSLFLRPSHGEIELGFLDFCLFSELAIFVRCLTLTFKPIQYVRKSYVTIETGVVTSTHE